MTRQILAKTLLIGGVILLGVLGMLNNMRLKSLPQKYSVGKVTNIVKPLKGGEQAVYLYSIGGVEYSNSINIGKSKSIIKIGEEFIVSIPIQHWDSGEILFDRPVPIGTISPLDGWDNIPEF